MSFNGETEDRLRARVKAVLLTWDGVDRLALNALVYDAMERTGRACFNEGVCAGLQDAEAIARNRSNAGSRKKAMLSLANEIRRVRLERETP